MPTVDPNTLELVRYEHDPYERDTEEEDDYEADEEDEPEPDEVLIRTVDVQIVDPDGKQLGNLHFWLMDRKEIVQEVGDFVALLDDHSQEASDFGATLFDHRGKIKRIVREGKGVWGKELNVDATVAYLQEIRIDKDFRSQGIGSWALARVLSHNRIYLDGAQFIFTLACALHSEWPDCTSYNEEDPYRSEKQAMSLRILGFFRRLGYRRVGTTAYFCCARSLSHPSRALPADQDAAEVEEADPYAGMDETLARAMTMLDRQGLN
ncbi:hypothetical protein JCM10908_000707 [Rhodotorula pacifica]|uniref:uncharacterized protein n=1 Tax=Rhodotorula pacifica TaxID=1495444 RepID=UPI003172127D